MDICEHDFGFANVGVNCQRCGKSKREVALEKHSHYFKDVRHLSSIDVYRVLELFGVTDPCIQHAVKKLLVSGGRGAGKDQAQDVSEAIDSLTRYQDMAHENLHAEGVANPQKEA
jgi:hypothetical protein